MQIRPDLVSGADDVVGFLQDYVGGLAIEASLVAALEVFSIPPDHREVTLGRRMKVGGLWCPFRKRVGRRRPAERPSHAGLAVCLRDRRMTPGAQCRIDVRPSLRLFAMRAATG